MYPALKRNPKSLLSSPHAGWRLCLSGGRVRGEGRTKSGHQEGLLSLNNIGSFPLLKTIHWQRRVAFNWTISQEICSTQYLAWKSQSQNLRLRGGRAWVLRARLQVTPLPARYKPPQRAPRHLTSESSHAFHKDTVPAPAPSWKQSRSVNTQHSRRVTGSKTPRLAGGHGQRLTDREVLWTDVLRAWEEPPARTQWFLHGTVRGSQGAEAASRAEGQLPSNNNAALMRFRKDPEDWTRKAQRLRWGLQNVLHLAPPEAREAWAPPASWVRGHPRPHLGLLPASPEPRGTQRTLHAPSSVKSILGSTPRSEDLEDSRSTEWGWPEHEWGSQRHTGWG